MSSITNFPHGISSFGAVLPYNWTLPQSRATPGRHLWVDGPNGSNSNLGRSPDSPVATVTRAVALASDGVPFVIHVFPGIYAETVTINKRNVSLVGEIGGSHPGIVQIVGTTTQTQATILVDDGFARGFYMANLSIDAGGDAQTGINYPCIEIITNDTGDATATNSDLWWTLDNIYINSSRTTVPTSALLLQGATLGRVYRCVFAGCDLGITFTGSANNNPTDIYFEDVMFFDNTRADIATATTRGVGAAATLGITPLVNIHWVRAQHVDRGGTPVTNYINVQGAVTNCGSYEFFAARDVADDTLMALPVDFIAIGRSAAAAEFIIGA